jgi:hypothetical protein
MLLPSLQLKGDSDKKNKKLCRNVGSLKTNKNYLSIDKLVKDQKIGEKKYSAPVHKTCSAISKYNDGGSGKV